MSGKNPFRRVGSRASDKRQRLIASQANSDISAILTKGLKEGIAADIAAGRSGAEISKKWEPVIAAKQVVIALTEIDSGKALAAIKDLRDRTTGRPKEHLELSGKWEKIPDDQLNAMVFSAMRELTSGEGKDGEPAGPERLDSSIVETDPRGEDPPS